MFLYPSEADGVVDRRCGRLIKSRDAVNASGPCLANVITNALFRLGEKHFAPAHMTADCEMTKT